jgi:hypothetical protein
MAAASAATLSLHHSGFDVIGCDFYSPSAAFLRWRSGGTIPVIEPDNLDVIAEFDTLWVIDTLDHLSNIEASLGPLLSVVNLVVTENLSTTRGHGRQRFHYRRTFPELAALFARYGLIPSTTSSRTPIMYWTRDRLAPRAESGRAARSCAGLGGVVDPGVDGAADAPIRSF